MQDRPTATELLQAVQAHLGRNVVPALPEPGLRFRTLVAANVLGIISRELKLASAQTADEWRRLSSLLQLRSTLPVTTDAQASEVVMMRQRLCAVIEEGEYDEPHLWQRLLDHCLRTAEEKLAISNPDFLARCQREVEP